MLSALPDTRGLTNVQACVALYRHGCSAAEIKVVLADRCAPETLRSALSQARLDLGWRKEAVRPLVRKPRAPVPPLEKLTPGERAALREPVARMGPAKRARFRALVGAYPAMEAAALALRPERRARPC